MENDLKTDFLIMNNTKTQELTRAELEIMQILWRVERGFVNDILESMPEPKPAYNTVSTIVRILEKKGFVAHKAFGKSHEYYPLISRTEYTSSFMTHDKGISVGEADEIIKMLKGDR